MHPAVEFHDRLAAGWARKYDSGSFMARARALLGLLDERDLSGQAWLDAGCGSGTLSNQLARRGCTVTAVDGSVEMIRHARRIAREQEPRAAAVRFEVVPTVERLDWPDGRFDGVLCASVIEYLDHPDDCLGELVRVLRPGGVLLVSVPNRRSLYRQAQRIAYRATRGVWPRYLGLSKNEYLPGEFVGLLERHGLKVAAGRFYGARLPGWLGRNGWIGALFLVLAEKP
jgi:2-polyprenyl-6-hydroxyphenyl methylase/3-demethylubiquinone-9 3-methyltransferase